MSYVYTVFGSTYAGGVVLPTTLHPFSETPGPITSPLVDLPGRSVWDSQGSGISKPETQKITHRGKVIAASAVALQTSRDALRALNGKRDILWETNDGGTTKRWRTARVMDVRIEDGIGSFYDIVEMDFELLPGLWNGAAHVENTALDSSSKSVVTVNGGYARVSDLIITVEAAGSTITALSVYLANVLHFHYTNDIDVGQPLIINCGARSVLNDGSDDYAHFALQSDHADNDWCPLEPGSTTLTVERTGGNNSSVIWLSYYDGFA